MNRRVWGQKLLLSICVREEGGEGPGGCQAVVLETRGHRWPLTWGVMERCRKTPLSAVDKGVCWRKCHSRSDNEQTMGLASTCWRSFCNRSPNLGMEVLIVRWYSWLRCSEWVLITALQSHRQLKYCFEWKSCDNFFIRSSSFHKNVWI